MITPDVARARPAQQTPSEPPRPEAEAEVAEAPEADFSDLVVLAGVEPEVADDRAATAEPSPPPSQPPAVPVAPPMLAAVILPEPEPEPEPADGDAPAEAARTQPAAGPAAPPAAAPAVPTAAAAEPAAVRYDEAKAAVEAEAGPEPEPDAAEQARPATTSVAAPTADLRPAAAAPVLVDAPRADAPAWRLAAAHHAAPHAAPASAASPRDVAAQLTLAIGSSSDGQVDIRLDPPELGCVQIRLHATETGGLQAVVLADRPETQDFLRRHADTLARDLGEAGYSDVSLEFASGGDARDREAPDAAGAFAWLATPDADTPIPPSARRPPAVAGLDIRL